MFRTAISTALGLLAIGVFAQPAFAADATDSAQVAPGITLSAPAVTGPRVQLPLRLQPAMAPTRPAALPALYVGLVVGQAYDVYSTRRALAAGATEANPIMQGGGARFWTMKAIGTVVPIVIAERMWKKNKVGAIVMMVVTNTLMATVAVNNTRVLRAQQ